MNGRITGVQIEIRRLQEERASLLGQREGLLEYKRLLYERGLGRLEPVVRKALDELGFQTTPPDVSPASQLEIHARTKGGSMPGVLEVRGSNRQLTGEVVSEFIRKLEADRRSTGIHSKGILVGNGFCEEPPEMKIRGQCLFCRCCPVSETLAGRAGGLRGTILGDVSSAFQRNHPRACHL
jgi:hypothetical protein